MKKLLALGICLIMIFAVTTTVSANSSYVTDGLVGQYSGSEFDDTTWTDLSGNGNDITVTIDDNNFFKDGAYHLDSIKVELPENLVAVPQGDEWTIEIQFGDIEPKGTGFNTFMNSSNDSYALFRRVPGDFIEFKCGGNDRPKVEGGLDYFNNSTISITYKVGGDCVLYVDGVAIGTTNPTTAVTNDDLYIGHPDASRNHATDYKAMRFYDRALSAEEIEQNYNADQGEAPSDTSDDTPSDTSDDTPSDTSDDTQSDTSDDTQSDTSDDTASDTSDDAQSDTSDDAQSDTSDDTQSDTSDDTQSDTSDDTQSDTSDDTQSDTSDDTQSDTSDDTQSETPSETSDAASTPEESSNTTSEPPQTGDNSYVALIAAISALTIATVGVKKARK